MIDQNLRQHILRLVNAGYIMLKCDAIKGKLNVVRQ